MEFDAAGDIVRLYDKQNEREVLADGQKGNVFQAFEDRPLDWEAWDIESYFDEKYWHADPASSIEVVESGPLRARIQIKRKVLGSKIIQDVILYRNSARLDFSYLGGLARAPHPSESGLPGVSS